MKGFKAFNANMTCREYQYKIGKTYVHEGPVEICSSGFHFCTNAQDILKYYLDRTMRICEIEASGIVSDSKNDCSKRSCSEITILREISFDEFYPLITESIWAYLWVRDIGNHAEMMPRIINPYWLNQFNELKNI